MMIVGCHLFAIVCPVLDGLHYLKHLGGGVCVCARQSPAVSRVVELLHQSLAQGGYIMYIIM